MEKKQTRTATRSARSPVPRRCVPAHRAPTYRGRGIRCLVNFTIIPVYRLAAAGRETTRLRERCPGIVPAGALHHSSAAVRALVRCYCLGACARETCKHGPSPEGPSSAERIGTHPSNNVSPVPTRHNDNVRNNDAYNTGVCFGTAATTRKNIIPVTGVPTITATLKPLRAYASRCYALNIRVAVRDVTGRLRCGTVITCTEQKMNEIKKILYRLYQGVKALFVTVWQYRKIE